MQELLKYGFIETDSSELRSVSLMHNFPLINQGYYTKYYETYFDCIEDAGGHGGLEVGICLNEQNNNCLVLSTTCVVPCCGGEIYSGKYDAENILKAIKEDIVKTFGNNIFTDTVDRLNN